MTCSLPTRAPPSATRSRAAATRSRCWGEDVDAMATQVAAVRVPTGGVRHEVRAASVVWQREMIRFSRDRARVVSSLVQPVLFLFVLGSGLSSLVRAGTGSVDFRTFLFPGVLATSVLFTAAFAGISMVWDREFGF